MTDFGDTPVVNDGFEFNAAEFLDFEDSRPLPPVGQYTLRVTNVETKHNEASGAYGFNWTLTIVGGQFDGQDVWYYTYVGRVVDGKLTERENGFSTRNMFAAIGLTPEHSPGSFDKSGRITDLRTEALSRMLRADLVHEEYNGQTNARPKRVYPTEPPFKKFTGDVL